MRLWNFIRYFMKTQRVYRHERHLKMLGYQAVLYGKPYTARFKVIVLGGH